MHSARSISIISTAVYPLYACNQGFTIIKGRLCRNYSVTNLGFLFIPDTITQLQSQITLQYERHSLKLIIKPPKVGAFSGELPKDYLLASDTVIFDRCCYVSGACQQYTGGSCSVHWPSLHSTACVLTEYIITLHQLGTRLPSLPPSSLPTSWLPPSDYLASPGIFAV